MESSSTTPIAKEKKGLGRLWKKFRTAFKDKKIPATSSPSTAKPATSMSTPVPAPVPSIPKEETPKVLEPEVPQSLAAEPPTSSEAPAQSDVDRRLEHARALFRKYNFDIDESEWKIGGKNTQPTERVHKPIRMRVRYTCHSCNTVFGHEKVCISCQHNRCSNCTRYPPKKDKTRKTDATPVPVEPTNTASDNKVACHECQTGFEIGAEKCPNCDHKICDRCVKQAIVTITPAPTTPTPTKKVAGSESTPVGAVQTIAT